MGAIPDLARMDDPGERQQFLDTVRRVREAAKEILLRHLAV
jgi:hypothetical protein